mmetsp:Transcript_65855/g.175388  ORF Transcript_65855/g.175388 Transcript_65855/m.175388 type:complete len:294 (+) Transcript_65855:1-882(+)
MHMNQKACTAYAFADHSNAAPPQPSIRWSLVLRLDSPLGLKARVTHKLALRELRAALRALQAATDLFELLPAVVADDLLPRVREPQVLVAVAHNLRDPNKCYLLEANGLANTTHHGGASPFEAAPLWDQHVAVLRHREARPAARDRRPVRLLSSPGASLAIDGLRALVASGRSCRVGNRGRHWEPAQLPRDADQQRLHLRPRKPHAGEALRGLAAQPLRELPEPRGPLRAGSGQLSKVREKLGLQGALRGAKLGTICIRPWRTWRLRRFRIPSPIGYQVQQRGTVRECRWGCR